jgi:hypothetical protein
MRQCTSGKVVRLEAAQAALRLAFLGWQCRLRQLAIRREDGRPSPGMRPLLLLGDELLGPITVVLSKRDDGASLAQFRHLARRTQDPRERREAALAHLAAAYYQQPASFDDRPSALFGPASRLARRLDGRPDCRLVFEQFSQRFTLACAAALLAPADDGWQATYWHNALFNPALPAGALVVRFTPDWARAEAAPPVG